MLLMWSAHAKTWASEHLNIKYLVFWKIPKDSKSNEHSDTSNWSQSFTDTGIAG